MSASKPVILIHHLDNRLVDEVAALLGGQGGCTTINTYNEVHAMDAVRQYERGFGWLTASLDCIVTGWNEHRKPADQFLYRLRARERRSPLRRLTSVILITEDHRGDLVERACDPAQGAVSAYLHRDTFRQELPGQIDSILRRGSQ
ncbi:MAG: hypothetical protein WEB57_07070 [Pseudohongiellaceae bacterium]